MTFDPNRPLAAISGETSKAHRAFLDYIEMGNTRSLPKLHAQYEEAAQEKRGRQPPTVRAATIEGWSSKHHWQARVKALQVLEAEQLQAEWRDKRRALLQGFYVKVAQALGKLEVEGASLSEVTRAVKEVSDQLRSEYDDLPTQRIEQSGSLTFTADLAAQAAAELDEWERAQAQDG